MRLPIFALILFWGINSASAQPATFSPEFDPNYTPDPSSDEGGFWYQIDNLEEDIKRSPHVIRDTNLNTYIEDMTCRIAAEYCPNIRVYIVNNPHLNASMYPNGMMHVHTGLILRVANESELASVIAHEIAHFLLSHQIKQWRNMHSSLITAAVFDVLLTGGLATMVAASNASAYSRTFEEQADMYGLQLLAAAGYETYEASNLWEYIETEREADESKSSRSAFFATHPKTEDRLNYLREASINYYSAETDNSQSSEANLHVKQVLPHYQAFMVDQIALQEIGQTEALLDRHDALGYSAALTNFFRGEIYRTRQEEGDIELAIDYYKKSLASNEAPPTTYKELAYLMLKSQREIEALEYFKNYLAVEPEASDIQMVNYYIQSLEMKYP